MLIVPSLRPLSFVRSSVLSIRLSVHPSVRPFVLPSVHQSFCPSVRSFVRLFVRPYVCCPSVRPSGLLSVHLTVRPAVRTSGRPSVRTSDNQTSIPSGPLSGPTSVRSARTFVRPSVYLQPSGRPPAVRTSRCVRLSVYPSARSPSRPTHLPSSQPVDYIIYLSPVWRLIAKREIA